MILQITNQYSFHSIIILLIFVYHVKIIYGTPVASPNWELLITPDGVIFSPRNAHASCVFNGSIWVTGGKTAKYTQYNLMDAYSIADVWKSPDGVKWTTEKELTGDFFAQNTDVQQPGPIPPWFKRYGHSLDAVDINGDGVSDVMILMGGYSPSPSNDIWITEDGINWGIVDEPPPWSARAWHFTVTFKGKLWMMGGTPLNNEVWYLNATKKIIRPRIPLTRSLYNNHTWKLTWVQAPDVS